MSFALSAGVTGVQAHQKMLDVAGNNLANINTVGYKASRIVFSELLSEIVKKASQPTSTLGGTNPQQMGSGVGISSISPNMAQGNITNTGNPLDLALQGEGYFVVSDGGQNLYTRGGAFTVDASGNMVDPSTGYIVQRIGSAGESDGFQTAGNSNIKIPYDVAIAASATTEVTVAGNLSADDVLETTQTNIMKSDIAFTTSSGNAVGSTEIDGLSQFTANGDPAAGTITFSGYDSGGTAFSASATLPQVALTMSVSPTTTLTDVLNKLNGTTGGSATSEVQTLSTVGGNPGSGHYHLTFGGQTTAEIAHNDPIADIKDAIEDLSNVGEGDILSVVGTLDAGDVVVTFLNTAGDVGLMGVDYSALGAPTTSASVAETVKGVAAVGSGILGTDATASLDNGKIEIRDTASGYSLADINMEYTAAGSETLTMPGYFEITTVGGEEVKNANIIVYDTQGGEHVLSAAFVRTDTANTWDMVLTAINGTIEELTYDNRRISGIEFSGIGTYTGLSSPTELAQFVITFGHDSLNPQTVAIDLGTAGQLDGLTQFASASTAVLNEQDGYSSGSLTSVSVSNTGSIIGSFSNGVKKTLAILKIGTFKNPAGLESKGNGYFSPSVNSGNAVATQAMVGLAGTIRSGALEKSNADVAEMFVQMIEAQNGYNANARTISIADDMLQELTNIIR